MRERKKGERSVLWVCDRDCKELHNILPCKGLMVFELIIINWFLLNGCVSVSHVAPAPRVPSMALTATSFMWIYWTLQMS